MAPLAENNQKILLELTGGSSISERPGLDLVAVIDVSENMNKDNKLEKMKIAMLFVIKKLSPIDCLSIVTFSHESKRQSKLCQLTQSDQKELEDLVNNLKASGYTNTFDGLQMGLKVLKGHKVSNGRACGIILMPDGEQTLSFGDAAKVPVGNVAVHTFGFGQGLEPTV